MPTSTKDFDYVPQLYARKALLLEDDRHFAEFLKEYLTTRGYTVVHVSNGADGVREVLGSDFDVIVCDMMMPKLPGDMFYLATERTKPHLCPRFVFITGNGSDSRVKAFIAKVNGVILHKPFHLDDLLRVLEKMEDQNRAG